MKVRNLARMTLIALIHAGVALAAQANAHAILHWETSIPLTEEMTIQVIADKASVLQHQDDDTGIICGGETTGYQLSDYYTFEDFDGNVTHTLKVQFLVTVPVNYCEDEALNVCEVHLNIEDAELFQVGRMDCSDVDFFNK